MRNDPATPDLPSLRAAAHAAVQYAARGPQRERVLALLAAVGEKAGRMAEGPKAKRTYTRRKKK